MTPLVADHSREIAEICRRFRVRRLSLFGSAVGERFDVQRSDVDFSVEFEPFARGEHANAYFGLLESLESLLSRHVDRVMVGAIRNRYFLEAIAPTRTLSYAA